MGRKSRKIDASKADRAMLLAIASHAIPRLSLQQRGFLPLLASSDLHPYGYTVRHWLRLKDCDEVLEYNARVSDLPRLTACCYLEQVAIHKALGVNVVGSGERWEDYQQRGLFDAEYGW